MITFSATIALEDDHGSRYDANDTLDHAHAVVLTNGGEVFSYTKGYGVDTDTSETEPIIIVQGSAPDAYTLDGIKNQLCAFADLTLRQRAIGWFTSSDSYLSTSA